MLVHKQAFLCGRQGETEARRRALHIFSSEGKYYGEKAGKELGKHGVAVLNTMTRKDLLPSLLNFLDM